MKIPLRWSRLPSLEGLLASSSEGLKYTRCLRIVTKQYPQEDNSYFNLDRLPETDDEDVVDNENESADEEGVELDDGEKEEEGEEEDGIFKVYHPHNSASNTLNAFIRVLISKLPLQQLHTFWYNSPPRNVQASSTIV